MKIRRSIAAILLAGACCAAPAFPQAGGGNSDAAAKQSEEARKKAQERLAAERAKQLAEKQRLQQHAEKVVKEGQKRAQEALKAAQEELRRTSLIPPWAAPWEVDADFAKVQALFDMAGAQHEIVMMLIDDGDFDEALQEASKIPALGLPDRYDLFVASELDEIADRLTARAQDDMALRVLDLGQASLHHPQAKADCLMHVAKIHRKNNRKDQALKAYREAIALNQIALSKQKPK